MVIAVFLADDEPPTPSLTSNQTNAAQTPANRRMYPDFQTSSFFALGFQLFFMLLHLHLAPLTGSGMGVLLRVAESGRGLSRLWPQLLDEVAKDVAIDAVLCISHPSALSYILSFDFARVGRGSCSARKPEAKQPPYAFNTSRDAALRRAIVCL